MIVSDDHAPDSRLNRPRAAVPFPLLIEFTTGADLDDEIETYLALAPAGRAKPTPLFFIFHLLGEWREKAAYRPLTRLLRIPGHEIDAIFGDGITSTSH